MASNVLLKVIPLRICHRQTYTMVGAEHNSTRCWNSLATMKASNFIFPAIMQPIRLYSTTVLSRKHKKNSNIRFVCHDHLHQHHVFLKFVLYWFGPMHQEALAQPSHLSMIWIWLSPTKDACTVAIKRLTDSILSRWSPSTLALVMVMVIS